MQNSGMKKETKTEIRQKHYLMGTVAFGFR